MAQLPARCGWAENAAGTREIASLKAILQDPFRKNWPEQVTHCSAPLHCQVIKVSAASTGFMNISAATKNDATVKSLYGRANCCMVIFLEHRVIPTFRVILLFFSHRDFG